MKPIDFVNLIRELVIEENTATYRDLFTNTDPCKASDEYWIEALALFNKLDKEDKATFFKVLRQIGVDTTSTILGVLDGVSYTGDPDNQFLLTTLKSSGPINGELQDVFLEQEENS